MFLRIGALVLALCGLIACAPLPPSLPQDFSDTPGISTGRWPPPADIPPRYALVPDNPVTDVSRPDSAPQEAQAVPVAVPETVAVPEPPAMPPPDTLEPAATRRLQTVALPTPLRRSLRIGLLFDKPRHRITGQGSWTVLLDNQRSLHLRHSIEVVYAKNQVHVRGDDGGWLGNGRRIEIQPWDEASTLVIDGKGYRGNLEFTAPSNGLQTVNIVSTEDYLKGVVPHEIGKLDATGLEALKVQAVAARTYAYRHFNSRSGQGFDMYADVRDQVYEGRNGEYPLSNQAIEATRGTVMQFQGNLIDAYYHSTCAGHTESVATWGRPDLPYLRAVPDLDPQGNPWCAASSYMQWTVRIADADLPGVIRRNAAQAKADKVFSFSSVEQIFILNRLPGGRVGDLLVSTDNGSLQVKGDRTRWLFKQGGKILPSANFSISRAEGAWIFTGKGFGHGIGMCQMGARGRSQAGQNFKDILWHYYPGIDLVVYQD
jgi:stage II sporulation protein D